MQHKQRLWLIAELERRKKEEEEARRRKEEEDRRRKEEEEAERKRLEEEERRKIQEEANRQKVRYTPFARKKPNEKTPELRLRVERAGIFFRDTSIANMRMPPLLPRSTKRGFLPSWLQKRTNGDEAASSVLACATSKWRAPVLRTIAMRGRFC